MGVIESGGRGFGLEFPRSCVAGEYRSDTLNHACAKAVTSHRSKPDRATSQCAGKSGPGTPFLRLSGLLALVSIMSIATKTGDGGTTGLMYNRRVSKSDPRVEAGGSIDEINTAVGAARAWAQSDFLRTNLLAVQKNLITIMG